MNLRSRWAVIAAVVAASVYLLWPSLRYATLPRDAAAADPSAAETLKRAAIGLGLDLQGGIHLALEVDAVRFRRDLVSREARALAASLERRGVQVLSVSPSADGVEVVAQADADAAAISEEAGRLDSIGTADPEEVEGAPDRRRWRFPVVREHLEAKIREATGRALEIVRNRVDAFGVSEPVIQQVEDRRIVVELPGITAPSTARGLVGRTALLGFHVVRDDLALDDAVRKVDAASSASGASGAGLLAKVQTVPKSDPKTYYVYAEDEDAVRAALDGAAPGVLPPGVIFSFGSVEERGARKIVPLYLLGEEPEMSGEHLDQATVGYDRFGKPAIYFRFDGEGAKRFGEVSGANVGKRLAIALDGRVQSAPTIRERITSSGEITGRFSPEEAKELAIVLEAGTLPAPLTILAEEAVGPSLGRDAIRRGSWATLASLLLVWLFMGVRYRMGGMVANIGVLLVVTILLAAMAALDAVLTLPGIAGIALTIGMAVDANVLIFERIREELAVGKTFRLALDAGFDRAYSAIVDSNLTTILAAVALYYWGSGPIRGFAVTLSVGVAASMFTAVYVTRTLLETLLARGAARVSL